MNGRLFLALALGFAVGVFLMDWLYERREMKRQERYWRRMLSERERPPTEFRRGSNPPPNAVKPPPPPNPPPMRVIREGVGVQPSKPWPRSPEDCQ